MRVQKKIAAGAYHFGFIILQGQFVKKNRRGRLSFSWVIILQVHFVSFSEKSHLSFFKSFSRFGFPSDPKEAFIILQIMFSVKFWHFLSLSFCKSSLFFPVSVYHFPGSFCQNFHQPHVQKIQTQQTPLKNPLKNMKQGKDNNDRHKTARRQLYCNFLLFSGFLEGIRMLWSFKVHSILIPSKRPENNKKLQ